MGVTLDGRDEMSASKERTHRKEEAEEADTNGGDTETQVRDTEEKQTKEMKTNRQETNTNVDEEMESETKWDWECAEETEINKQEEKKTTWYYKQRQTRASSDVGSIVKSAMMNTQDETKGAETTSQKETESYRHDDDNSRPFKERKKNATFTIRDREFWQADKVEPDTRAVHPKQTVRFGNMRDEEVKDTDDAMDIVVHHTPQTIDGATETSPELSTIRLEKRDSDTDTGSPRTSPLLDEKHVFNREIVHDNELYEEKSDIDIEMDSQDVSLEESGVCSDASYSAGSDSVIDGDRDNMSDNKGQTCTGYEGLNEMQRGEYELAEVPVIKPGGGDDKVEMEALGYEGINSSEADDGNNTLSDNEGNEAVGDNEGNEVVGDNEGNEAVGDNEGNEAVGDNEGNEALSNNEVIITSGNESINVIGHDGVIEVSQESDDVVVEMDNIDKMECPKVAKFDLGEDNTIQVRPEDVVVEMEEDDGLQLNAILENKDNLELKDNLDLEENLELEDSVEVTNTLGSQHSVKRKDYRKREANFERMDRQNRSDSVKHHDKLERKDSVDSAVVRGKVNVGFVEDADEQAKEDADNDQPYVKRHRKVSTVYRPKRPGQVFRVEKVTLPYSESAPVLKSEKSISNGLKSVFCAVNPASPDPSESSSPVPITRFRIENERSNTTLSDSGSDAESWKQSRFDDDFDPFNNDVFGNENDGFSDDSDVQIKSFRPTLRHSNSTPSLHHFHKKHEAQIRRCDSRTEGEFEDVMKDVVVTWDAIQRKDSVILMKSHMKEKPRSIKYDASVQEYVRRLDKPIVRKTPQVQPDDYLRLSCAVCLVCNVLFGVIALFFSLKSNKRYERGDLPGARGNARVALILSILGVIITLTVVIVVLSLNWPHIRNAVST